MGYSTKCRHAAASVQSKPEKHVPTTGYYRVKKPSLLQPHISLWSPLTKRMHFIHATDTTATSYKQLLVVPKLLFQFLNINGHLQNVLRTAKQKCCS